MKIEKAVILAAGRGTRMRELTLDLPKPMIEVRGKPVLQHIVEGLRDAGIRDFLIVVGYRAENNAIHLAAFLFRYDQRRQVRLLNQFAHLGGIFLLNLCPLL